MRWCCGLVLASAVEVWGLLPQNHQAFAQPTAEAGSVLGRQVRELHEAGRFREALDLAKRYVDEAKRSFGEGDLRTTNSLLWLAHVHVSLGQLQEAETPLRSALAIREAKLPATHADVATVLNNLAHLLVQQGRLGEAEGLYAKSLKINEGTLDPKHPRIAAGLNNLASL
jgi:tetratricopeptide (TPR) repeat protein